ncbi:hypothetical protein [Caulobacter sp. 1776]|uniref:hypothetical protein n=1 Tax=Caulobacter sp. 1776 TaxID=3156420 RepID=UPI00339A55E8
MPTYLFYPRRADGVSLTFIAEVAQDDRDALELAGEIAAAHACVGVFVWQPAADEGKDRFVGEVVRPDAAPARETAPRPGASATV